MEVLVKISDSLDKNQVERFLAALRIPNLVFRSSSDELKAPSAFRLRVVSASQHWESDKIEIPCETPAESVLLFNPEAEGIEEPKVIYTTDHSARAESNLSSFKQLKPSGFAGAYVVEDMDDKAQKNVWKGNNNPFVKQMASAVLATRANLIIANFDCSAAKHVAHKLAGLARLARPNGCHVLILKA